MPRSAERRRADAKWIVPQDVRQFFDGRFVFALG